MPALRGDLIITRQLFEGRTYYVVKDPISLQYFRMSAEDYFLATLFNGQRTFGQDPRCLLERFPARAPGVFDRGSERARAALRQRSGAAAIPAACRACG